MFEFFNDCMLCVESTVIEIVRVDLAIIENKISTLLAKGELKIELVHREAMIKSAYDILGDGAEVKEVDLNKFIDSHVNTTLRFINATHEIDNAHYSEYSEIIQQNEIIPVSGALESTHDHATT